VGQSCFRAGAGQALQKLEWDNGCGTCVQGGQHLMEIGVGQQQFGGWGYGVSTGPKRDECIIIKYSICQDFFTESYE
jgi:hypothetical protein